MIHCQFFCFFPERTGKNVHRPAPVRNFSLPKKTGATEDRSRWQIWVFSWFLVGFLYPPPAWRAFLRGQKVPQKIFFRWWSCTLCFSLREGGRIHNGSRDCMGFINRVTDHFGMVRWGHFLWSQSLEELQSDSPNPSPNVLKRWQLTFLDMLHSLLTSAPWFKNVPVNLVRQWPVGVTNTVVVMPKRATAGAVAPLTARNLKKRDSALEHETTASGEPAKKKRKPSACGPSPGHP